MINSATSKKYPTTIFFFLGCTYQTFFFFVKYWILSPTGVAIKII